MRALSLTRPWTWLVLHGGKDIENRSWPTRYRGPLVIHGAMSKDVESTTPFLNLLTPTAASALDQALADGSVMDLGLLGVVDVVGCCTSWVDGGLVHCACSGWAMPGQAHWQLANPRPFRKPIPARGALGLWPLTRDQHDAVALRLRRTA